jgi:glycosyltransferase involved in cell wall biosynthesis
MHLTRRENGLKRLLLVSYYYPPLAGSGVFRPLRFSKYLPRRNWQVTVLTVSERVRVLRDPGLSRDVPPDVRVERTATVEPRSLLLVLNRLGLSRVTGWLHRWLMIPDDQRGWVPFALRRARQLLARQPHHAILSTSAPYSAHLIGVHLRRSSGLPWIADFRDEWTTNPYFKELYPTEWHRRLNRSLEQTVLREAQAVLSVSRPWLEAHRSLVPEQPASKFHVHPNGFDAEHHRPVAPASDRFRVVYAGTFYGHRSASVFLEGLRRALGRGLPPGETEVLFVGHGSGGQIADGLPEGLLRTEEHRPYFDTLDLLARAAVLLLVVPRAGGAGNHTGKLFPYLASGRPILLLAPEPNVAADLVRSSRSGVVVPPDDPDRAADALLELHRDWKERRSLQNQDRELIAEYEASRQAERLVALLEELTG